MFALGDCIVQRKRRWPMGGPMSSAATCIDLDEGIRQLYTLTSKVQEVGWALFGQPVQHLVQGLQHVDDTVNVPEERDLCRLEERVQGLVSTRTVGRV